MSDAQYAAWLRPFADRDRQSRSEAARLARSLSEPELARPTGDTGWSVRDEITHMATADSDFLPLLRAVLAGEPPDTSVLADTDARNAHHLEANRGRPIAEIAAELEANALALEPLWAQLRDEEETRQPDGIPFPLRGLIEGYSMHHAYHVEQIQNALTRVG